MQDVFVDHLGTMSPVCTAYDARLAALAEQALAKTAAIARGDLAALFHFRRLRAGMPLASGPTHDGALADERRVPLPSNLGYRVGDREYPYDGGPSRPAACCPREVWP